MNNLDLFGDDSLAGIFTNSIIEYNGNWSSNRYNPMRKNSPLDAIVLLLRKV